MGEPGEWDRGAGEDMDMSTCLKLSINQSIILFKKGSVGLSSLWKHYHQFHMSLTRTPCLPFGACIQPHTPPADPRARPCFESQLDQNCLTSRQSTAELSTRLPGSRRIQLNPPLSLWMPSYSACWIPAAVSWASAARGDGFGLE